MFMHNTAVRFSNMLLTLTILLCACSKPGDPVSTPNPPDTTKPPVTDTTPFVKANFIVQSGCILSVFTDTLQNLFQPLFFVNKSDQGKNIHYRWSFGDNSFSDSVNPTHAYLIAGTYPVQLVTYYDDNPKHTHTPFLRIIINVKY